MRRVILGLVTTAVALVLLLSFKTHTQPAVPGSTPASVVGSPTPGRRKQWRAVPPRARARRRAPRCGRRGADGYRGGVPDDLRPGPGQDHRQAAGSPPPPAWSTRRSTPRDQQINSYAIPLLNAEAVAAGSAKMNAVSSAPRTPRAVTSARCRTPCDQLNGA